MKRAWSCLLTCLWVGFFQTQACEAAATTNVLVWNKAKDRVDADVRGWELFSLLERIASTGDCGYNAGSKNYNNVFVRVHCQIESPCV